MKYKRIVCFKKYCWIIFILLILIFPSCKKDNSIYGQCFIENSYPGNGQKLLISIDLQVNSNCVYKLNSSYLDSNVSKKLLFDGINAFVILNNEVNKFELLFSYNDPVGSTKKIKITDRNWLEQNGLQYKTRTYDAELMQKLTVNNERFSIIKIHQLITAFHDIGNMNGIVFFSDKKGFVGSYYQIPTHPHEIIQKAGYILEDKIDYSEYSFNEIK